MLLFFLFFLPLSTRSLWVYGHSGTACFLVVLQLYLQHVDATKDLSIKTTRQMKNMRNRRLSGIWMSACLCLLQLLEIPSLSAAICSTLTSYLPIICLLVGCFVSLSEPKLINESEKRGLRAIFRSYGGWKQWKAKKKVLLKSSPYIEVKKSILNIQILTVAAVMSCFCIHALFFTLYVSPQGRKGSLNSSDTYGPRQLSHHRPSTRKETFLKGPA